jgi:hypothetical protein
LIERLLGRKGGRIHAETGADIGETEQGFAWVRFVLGKSPNVGRKLTVKADWSSVTIYDQHHEIVKYARCRQRGQTFGAERFQ